ncbi:MAG: crosslink repair DNA glycosylase YcaQ family protein, partial [Bryobacteraceae bacterium]
ACTYVLPASDYALALTLAAAAGTGEMKTALKLGVTEKEVDALCDAVLLALKSGLAEPDQIRASVGPKARSLGPEGQKKGLSSTLPLALGRLQLSGHIRRLPTNGRLDQQRYRYALWNPNPLKACKLSREEAHAALARLYFQWIGPATPAEFQWFSGLGVKAAKDALAPHGLVPFEPGSDRLLFPQDLDALRSFKPPKDPVYRLVSSLDSLVLLRRDHRSLMDPADLGRSLPLTRGQASIASLADLPCHAILDRGRLVGLWEYDPASESIACLCFIQRNRSLDAVVSKTEEYVRTQLGDARSFSLDSPKSRQPRIAALRQAAG